MDFRRKGGGFTIVELLIVIVIIGVLAGLIIVSYVGLANKAIAASLTSDLKNASTKLELYKTENSKYPESVTDCPNPAAVNICLGTSSGNSFTSYTVDNESSPQTYRLIASHDGGMAYVVTQNGEPSISNELAEVSAEVLVVAGGGGGGSKAGQNCGGGGAGGVVYQSDFTITNGDNYDVIVGNGGGQEANGENSIFDSISAIGGGHGGCATVPTSGGSGGGAHWSETNQGAGTSGQGFAGGGGTGISSWGAGGGGGASEAGNTNAGAAGGDGLAFDISGSSVYYGGGGGGGVSGGGVAQPASLGGGGRGSYSPYVGGNGTPNTGGGGGGGADGPTLGGSGGSGVVIVRYKTSELLGYTGGTITHDGEYTIHTFTDTGANTFRKTSAADRSIELLVVAGGGGGGTGKASSWEGGGGGAGGALYRSSYTITSGDSYVVKIGAGGAADSNGQNSSFGTLKATGGGHGGGSAVTTGIGAAGGSGGGSFNSTSVGSGLAGQGFGGGTGGGCSAGGGGGGGGVGLNYSSCVGGAGGIGFLSSISGVSTYYAGGGGGSGSTAGAGGLGGGAAGNASGIGYDATANTGGGGGGGRSSGNYAGGHGGSGVVIIRYKTGTLSGYLGGTVTYDGDYTVHTFTSSGIFGQDGGYFQSLAYSYTGSAQTFTAPVTGNYIFELWGASGGDVSYGGKGAYTYGMTHIDAGTNIYVNVGQVGQLGSTVSTYGGGGGIGLPYSTYSTAYSGGGATDIRLSGGAWDSADGLRSRIMVAAGGGGGGVWNSYTGGYAGGIAGGAGRIHTNGSALGATQTTGYAFGIGQKAADVTSYFVNGSEGRGGGGGGYYGGYAQQYVGYDSNAAGGGGSSFVSGYAGCNAVDASGSHTGQPNHYSGYIFSNIVFASGSSNMPTTSGASVETGHQGNGYAVITWVQ